MQENNNLPTNEDTMNMPGMSGEKLMIANQSVQQIGEVGHVQEDDEPMGGSQENLGIAYGNNQSKAVIGHNDSYG